MEGQSNLWGHINEALAQQQPHRFGRVVQVLLQLLSDSGGTGLLTMGQNQLLNLFHTLHTLHDPGQNKEIAFWSFIHIQT